MSALPSEKGTSPSQASALDFRVSIKVLSFVLAGGFWRVALQSEPYDLGVIEATTSRLLSWVRLSPCFTRGSC